MGEFVYPISLEELYIQKQRRPRVETLNLRRTPRRTPPDGRTRRKPCRRVNGGSSRRKQASARTEFNKRFSFSLACFTFALIGIPLGITAHRQETSIGFGISLGVAFTYFLIILVVNIFREKASLHPELLIWLPNVIFLLFGGILFARMARR